MSAIVGPALRGAVLAQRKERVSSFVSSRQRKQILMEHVSVPTSLLRIEGVDI
jgi:hypothetical protein